MLSGVTEQNQTTDTVETIYELKTIVWVVVFWVVTPCSSVVITSILEDGISIFMANMETVCSSETLVTTYKTPWCYNPGHYNPYFHNHENFKF
jgi:hypothetical protein